MSISNICEIPLLMIIKYKERKKKSDKVGLWRKKRIFNNRSALNVCFIPISKISIYLL